MLDLSYVAHRLPCPPAAGRRILILVDPYSTHPGWTKAWLAEQGTPREATLLWVVTPSSLISWGALAAEPVERASMLLAALGERMEQARRRMAPLHLILHAAQIPCRVHVMHGAVVESVGRAVADHAIEQVLLPPVTGGGYGHAPAELAAHLTRRLECPVVLLD